MIKKSLGKVGIANKGEFAMDKTYNQCDFVYYKGSSWLALKNDLVGIEPTEGANWKYLARGFEAELLNMITATDTLGLLGEAGQKANAQNLIDVIADKVATKLIEKGMIANNLVTDNTEMVLSAPMGKLLKQQLDEQNNNLNHKLKIKMFDSIDVRTLGAGNYYITNGLNMPPNFPHGYLTVQRLDDYWAFLIFQQPYGSNYQNYITKQTNGIWQDWERVITKQCFKNEIKARFPFIVYDNTLYVSYVFPVPFDTNPSISIQFVDIDGYGDPDTKSILEVNKNYVCFKFTKSNMQLQTGQCYMGQLHFTIY